MFEETILAALRMARMKRSVLPDECPALQDQSCFSPIPCRIGAPRWGGVARDPYRRAPVQSQLINQDFLVAAVFVPGQGDKIHLKAGFPVSLGF